METVFKNFPWIVRQRLPQLAGDHSRVRDLVIQEYLVWTPPPDRYSFRVASKDKFFGQLYDRFFFECLRYFHPFTLHPESSRSCYAYVQNNERSSPVWHDHLRTSTISGVYYLSVPDPAAHLCFRYIEQERGVRVEEGFLYLFPRWLLHKPLPQTASDYRISLNIELISNECPIARNGGWRW